MIPPNTAFCSRPSAESKPSRLHVEQDDQEVNPDRAHEVPIRRRDDRRGRLSRRQAIARREGEHVEQSQYADEQVHRVDAAQNVEERAVWMARNVNPPATRADSKRTPGRPERALPITAVANIHFRKATGRQSRKARRATASSRWKGRSRRCSTTAPAVDRAEPSRNQRFEQYRRS